MQFLTTGFNILLIILGFGVLIFIHELGHFIAAKWAGIRTEAFAVGMGPVAVAWRKGIGLRFGSTYKEYEQRARASLPISRSADRPDADKVEGGAELRQEAIYRAGDKLGLGETEYSIRWLPLGGFVKMLGQEDANPKYVSSDPRSYNRCPVGKRMIVVSAGVIMNLLLAIVLFIIAFSVGVKLEAPVVGGVAESLPAGRTAPDNAKQLGVTQLGLQPGDEVISIDGDPARTFADIHIASAMSKPGVPLQLLIKRTGYAEPLAFTLLPEKDPAGGLLSIGVSPGRSNTLDARDDDGAVAKMLSQLFPNSGIKPGMSIVSANSRPVTTYEQFQQVVRDSNGQPVRTVWQQHDKDGNPRDQSITADVQVLPAFSILRYPASESDELQNYEEGLLGLTPLVKLAEVSDGPNAAVLKEGDIVLRIGTIEGPTIAAFRREVHSRPKEQIALSILRDGQQMEVTASIDSKGKLNVYPTSAWELPLVAQPLPRIRLANPPKEGGTEESIASPAAPLGLLPRTRIDRIGDVAVNSWAEIRHQLRLQTAVAKESNSGASVPVTVTLPTPGAPQETHDLALSAADITALHDLGWKTELPSVLFDPIYIVRTADGNPMKAITMGFDETYKLIMMTYLTLDRLFRGSVGVDQLRGPVGIVHIGSQIADKGFMYLIFFLAMISVNLAVINFLPMPIVDGGLFLFLIYEKFKGQPPPLAFQNAATMVGLFIIGTLFVVTFYNDVLRLFS